MTHRVCFLFALAAVLTAVVSPATLHRADAETHDSATLTWTAPGDDWDEGRAWQYDLRFSTEPIIGTDSLGWWNSQNTVTCSGLPRPSEAGQIDSFVVGGLLPSRTYYFVLRTSDEVGNWSFFSNVAIVTTGSPPDTSLPGDETPPAPVAGLTATTVPEGIFLTWSPSPDPDVAGYLIYRGYSQGELGLLTHEPVNTTDYLDTDLIAGVTYFYGVTALDDSGNESAIGQSVSAGAPYASPQITQLLAPFPSPCLKEVVLRYDLADRAATYSLRVFDANGRLVRNISGGNAEPGQYSVLWDLRGDDGERVAPGVYFSVLATDRSASSKKVLVLK